MLVEFLHIFVADAKVILGYNSVASSKAYSLINARDILKMFLRGVLTLPLTTVYDGDSLRKCSQKAPSDISDRVLHTSLSSNELEKLIFLKDTLKTSNKKKNQDYFLICNSIYILKVYSIQYTLS